MRVIGLIIALALLAVGLYRLFLEERAARLPQKPDPKPDPGKPAARTEPAKAEAAKPPAKSDAVKAEPAKAAAPAKPPAGSNGKAEPAPAQGRRDGGDPDIPAQAGGRMLPSMLHEHDADEDITIITLAPSPAVLTAM